MNTRESIRTHFNPLWATLSSPPVCKTLRFLNLNRTQTPIPLFTFTISSALLVTLGSKALLSFYTEGFPTVFPWLSVAFVCGFTAGVGQCHPVFQADVNYWVCRGGTRRDTEEGGGCNYMCIWRGFEQLGRVILAAFVIHMSVGGSHAGTRMYSPETCGKFAPREIQMIRNTDDVCFGIFLQ